ncbi:type II toxin-antitoxin system death-on-curing family toxin [Campylobacter sp. RM16187]|uniref:type II toxin-antitoxin system death-on-curing family toxin n=1 Tax=Campylobacter sp. RM16187 TaxID=1660063 RepID=UPI0021B64004|nr:Fic family protein [Campylobacter sp. RM16187]QKG28751.1 Fic/DOC family protein [Campylobacter sp. RM16187]
MRYFDINEAIELHDIIMSEIGGKRGFNESQISLLDSVISSIQNDDYYPSFIDKLTHLIFSCVKFHPFLDGNKRSAIFLAIFFMELNDKADIYEEFAALMEDVVVEVAAGNINKDELRLIIGEFIKPLK